MKNALLVPERKVLRAADGSSEARFVRWGADQYAEIEDLDALQPFLVSLVGPSDLWLFASSTGALTAGRRTSDEALFPYVTEDMLHDLAGTVGPKTIIVAPDRKENQTWVPFSRPRSDGHAVRTRLLKNTISTELVFEETNLDWGAVFSFSWTTSARHGLVRTSALRSSSPLRCRIVDGLSHLLPWGIPAGLQLSMSALTDAYKRVELVSERNAAILSLTSGISDRPHPHEILRAATVFALGLGPSARILISEHDVSTFAQGGALSECCETQGERGAFFVAQELSLFPHGEESWTIVADTGRSQTEVSATLSWLAAPREALAEVQADVRETRAGLERLLAASDGFQATGRVAACVAHTAHTTFNLLRGGVPYHAVSVWVDDFLGFVGRRNEPLLSEAKQLVAQKSGWLGRSELVSRARLSNNPHLERLALEYMPLMLGRRHGDPSRPWNRFAIQRPSEEPTTHYEGNWRDIFQNWEALLVSHPSLAWHAIAKFLNASTVDGFNPYRLDSDGIDWERPSSTDPWCNYGYWGDHQAIYLCRLLEVAEAHFPGEARSLLERSVFSFADVPYRMKSYDEVLAAPKSSLWFDEACDEASRARTTKVGTDGKLVVDGQGAIHLATLAEKLLLVVLGRLVHLVPGGGIWMNTQRPEWNDANNALAGFGLSVVTVAQLRRLVAVVKRMLCEGSVAAWPVHESVAELLVQVTKTMHDPRIDESHVGAFDRAHLTRALGDAGEVYRSRVYELRFGEIVEVDATTIETFFQRTLAVLETTLRANRREDGLIHSYNLLRSEGASELHVDRLGLMLEGQVAVLGAEVLGPEESARLLEALRDSSLYSQKQGSYLLYPPRRISGFLEKNRLEPASIAASPLLRALVDMPGNGVVERGGDEVVRFDASLTGIDALQDQLAVLAAHPHVGPLVARERPAVLALYSQLLGHDRFLGRSMSMFAYEGIGSVYWHMVSKLLLAAWEIWTTGMASGQGAAYCNRIKALAQNVGAGLGFCRSAESYGAFPTDPYSHTPGAGGARQPGMTGQVKENILVRRVELGVHVSEGSLQFLGEAIHPKEWLTQGEELAGTSLMLEPGSFGCILYGIPVVWTRGQGGPQIRVTSDAGHQRRIPGAGLDEATSRAVFERTGEVVKLEVMI